MNSDKMMIQGSSKRKISFAYPFIFASALCKDEAVDIFGNQVIVYMIALSILIVIIENIFDRKETMSHDFQMLNLDLARCLVDIRLEDIKSIHLRETINDLIIETKGSTHMYKLYGFRRKKINKFLESIHDYTED